MHSIRFEWDAKKSLANEQKHNVSFAEAQTVFFDANARLIFDDAHSSGEDRFVLLGLSSALRILVVVHCCRGTDNQIIRIISARKATKNERKQYEDFLP